MEQVSKLSFAVKSFRHLDTPFEKQGYRDYFAVVDIKDLPDLSGWRKINVRDPKLTGSVPEAIRSSLKDNPEQFLFMNRGIVISVESVEFNNKTSELIISLRDPKLHGLLDGGHTYNILMEERGGLPHSQFIRVEFLEGFGVEDIADVVNARNKSNVVRDQSLMNLEGKFDLLKEALKGASYADQIAYKEFDVDDQGNPRPIDVRTIVAILSAFDRDHFNARIHPISSYSSKAVCLEQFKNHPKSYEKLYPLATEILELFDHIQVELPIHYNKGGGKFGNLTGVTNYQGKKRKPHMEFLGKPVDYGVPEGFVFPVLGAFRALLEEKSKRYVWGKGLDPIDLLRGDLGKQLADTIGNFALENRNPSKTGKSLAVWQACYSLGEIAYLRA